MVKKGKLHFSYDSESDVFYCSIGKPQPAECLEMGNGVLIRVDPKNKTVVGLTVIDFKRRLAEILKA